MRNFILRPYKFVKIIANIFIGISIIIGLALCFIAAYEGLFISFMFLVLGLLLRFAYQKEYIIFGENDLFISKAFRKAKTCSYAQIEAFLIIAMEGQTQFVLAGRNGERLASLDSAFSGIEKGIEILEKNGIQIIDIARMIEENQPIGTYLPAMTKIQRINVQHMMERHISAEDMRKDSAPFDPDKTKKRLRILNIALFLAIVCGFFIGGKALFGICIILLLFVYGLYIHYYPYMHLESVRRKTQDHTLQIPWLAPIASLLILISSQEYFSFKFLPYLAFVLAFALILYLPFLLKVRFHAIQSRTARMASVFFATLLIAYTVSFPLNVLLTFETPVHTDATVTDKDEIKGKHDDWYIDVDDGTQFSVSEDEYQEIKKGDAMRVCNRTSLFGFEYSTLHE